MNRYDQSISRADFVRKRRSSRSAKKEPGQAGARPSVRHGAGNETKQPSAFASLFLPVKPVEKPRSQGIQFVSSGRRARYESVYTTPRAGTRSPALNLPEFNPRWISAALSGLLIFVLYTLWTSSTFIVSGAEISGNIRVDNGAINSSLHMLQRPIFAARPESLEETLRTSFPDLSAASVHVAFPNRLIVEVVERTPVLAWYQNGAMGWIDASGVAFPARGSAEGMINVVASGSPGFTPNPDIPGYEQVYVPPAMVQAFAVLQPYVPSGVPLIYDPGYGMGWQDPRGWQVYFGHDTQEIAIKVRAYQAIVDRLLLEGRQPSLIDLTYLDTPVFK